MKGQPFEPPRGWNPPPSDDELAAMNEAVMRVHRAWSAVGGAFLGLRRRILGAQASFDQLDAAINANQSQQEERTS